MHQAAACLFRVSERKMKSIVTRIKGTRDESDFSIVKGWVFGGVWTSNKVNFYFYFDNNTVQAIWWTSGRRPSIHLQSFHDKATKMSQILFYAM